MIARRYLFALVDQGGNIPPEVGAVRRLVDRGHKVTALGDDTIAEEVRASGAIFRPWIVAPNKRDHGLESDRIRDWECKYPWQLVRRLAETQFVGPAPRYAADIKSAIAHERPDAIVCSMFCMGAMVVAEAERIPFVALYPNVYPMPAEGLPPFGVGLSPSRGLLGRCRDRAINSVAEYLWNAFGLQGLNALRLAHGLPPLARFFDQASRASRQLILTARSFDFPAILPAGVAYGGPILDDPFWARSEGWEPPTGDSPFVLVSLSTTYQDHVGLLRRIVLALGSLPVRAMVTTGPSIAPEELPSASNVSVVASAPHRAALRHADLVVSHGGHGTAIKALTNGVPMVILPHGRDQADTAARVSARGAGITLRKSSSVGVIAATVRRVIEDPAYRIAARRLGEAILEDTRDDALVLALEDAVNQCPRHAMTGAAQRQVAK